jgi:hypothetical protein
LFEVDKKKVTNPVTTKKKKIKSIKKMKRKKKKKPKEYEDLGSHTSQAEHFFHNHL